MVGFICTKCNFKFAAEKLTRCPYCDRMDGVEQEKSAEDLIREIVDFE